MLAFCGYALAAPSGWYWLDSAELSAAAVGLGSPHPTGFPLYCVLGKAAQLVPLGEMAFRVELLSALAGALAVLFIARLVLELARDDAAGLVGAVAAGAALAVSLVFARQATVAEVYAPTAALLAGALLLFARVARGGNASNGLALAAVCGLGLGTHVSFVLMGLPVAALLIVRLYRGARWPLTAPLVTVLVAGALYMYLPVRSATGRIQAIDWGHPRTASALVDHMSAAGVRRAYAGSMGATESAVLGQEVGSFAESVADSVGPLMLLAALFGLIWLFRHRRTRWAAASLAAVLVGDASYSIWINPMGAPDLQNTVPLALALCACGGVGVAWLGRWLGRIGPYVGAVVGVVLVASPALVSVPAIWPASSGDLPRALSEAALDATPPRGVALVQSDSLAAGLMYLTAVEGARPDVAALVRQLRDDERGFDLLARAGHDLGQAGQAGDAGGGPLAWSVAHAPALTWEIGDDATPPGTALMAAGPALGQLVRTQAEKQRAATLASDGRADIRAAVEALERLFDHPASADRVARRTRATLLSGLGRQAFGRGDIEFAELLFEAAIRVRPEHASAWVNLGAACARRGDFARALEYTERALALEPNRVTALVNAARYASRQGDGERAARHIERALRLTQGRADAWALAAVIDLQAGRRERAMERLERARAIDPTHPDVTHLEQQLGP